MPSRFDVAPSDAFPGMDAHPVLPAKLDRAIRRRRGATTLTKAEADFLIRAAGGPDPDHPNHPQEMIDWRGIALLVRADDPPQCWRL